MMKAERIAAIILHSCPYLVKKEEEKKTHAIYLIITDASIISFINEKP